MKFGFVFPKPDPAGALEAAVAAENAGWDAFFVWEEPWGMDPWVTMVRLLPGQRVSGWARC